MARQSRANEVSFHPIDLSGDNNIAAGPASTRGDPLGA